MLQIEYIHSRLNALVFDAMYKSPQEILKFVETVLLKLIPVTNYIMMDVKYRIISYFGRIPDLKWEGKTSCYIFYIYTYSLCTSFITFLYYYIYRVINVIYFRSHQCRT